MIQAVNVNKTIKGNTVLKDINLTVHKGKTYGFVGRNGSGKTMLFRALAGLIHPNCGTITVEGKRLGKDIAFPESLGIIIEQVGFWPWLTGYENLLTLAKIKNKIGPREVKKVLELVGLALGDKRPFSKYSLGMKQRLAIAQAVMERPRLLILDEPTNSLDKEGVELFHRIIMAEKQQGVTILLASHIAADIQNLCDTIVEMEAGGISGEACHA